jgi:hypothetical protein
MNRAFLERLGLAVREVDGEIWADLSGVQAFNPLTRQPIEAVTYRLLADRLEYVAPPELVGAQPIHLGFLTAATRLDELAAQTLSEHLFQLERRSSELSAMGLSPQVDPQTLELTAELDAAPITFIVAADRAGQFRVGRVLINGEALPELSIATDFELSEHRDRASLRAYLLAMIRDLGEPAPPPPAPTAEEAAVPFTDLAQAFGEAALPPRSSLEVVATVLLRGEELRFAAARVRGRTFRGLLAGAQGKLWADRFELDDFAGVRALVAHVLQVPLDDVQVVPFR